MSKIESICLLFLVGFCLWSNVSANNTESSLEPHSDNTSETNLTTTSATSTQTPTTTTLPTTTIIPTTIVTTTTTSPIPDPSGVPKYVVRKLDNVCIIMQSNMELSIPYYEKNKEKSSLTIIKLNSNSNSSVSGSCERLNQSIIISWTQPETIHVFKLEFEFSKLPSEPLSEGDMIVNFIRFSYTLNNEDFPGTNETGPRLANVSGAFFKTPENSHYLCNSRQTIPLGEKSPMVVSLATFNLKVESFRNSTSTDFKGDDFVCSADTSANNVVPIAVGVSLAILIVVALIAFFIGNRRRHQQYMAI